MQYWTATYKLLDYLRRSFKIDSLQNRIQERTLTVQNIPMLNSSFQERKLQVYSKTQNAIQTLVCTGYIPGTMHVVTFESLFSA